ncbi:MAG: XkdW family protein [Pseudomonadota bacterium]|nr:XkdW family protein [Pseudomonadota bacterium]
MNFDSTTLNVLVFILVGVCFWIFIVWQNTRRINDQIHQVAHQQSLARNDDPVREICRAIHFLQPAVTLGIDYIIQHDDPSQPPYISEWHASEPQPAQEDIQAALSRLANGSLEAEYASLRKAEYPNIGEQLDAAYQARQGNDAKQIEIDEKIRLIKEKYPKSDECL